MPRLRTAAAALAVLLARARVAGAEVPPAREDAERAERGVARGADALGGALARILAPFASPRASFFHAPLAAPLLRAARTLEPGASRVRLRWSSTRSIASAERSGHHERFDGTFHEWARLELDYGVVERAEIFVSGRVTGWDERHDTFRVFSGGAFPSVEGEREKLLSGDATSRHENLSDVVVGGAFELWRGANGMDALAVAAQAKVPVARSADLTHAGTTDLALTLLGSVAWGRVALHANAGVVCPIGGQTIFEEDPDVRVDAFAHAAAGVTYAPAPWLAVGASVEGATAAWRGVPFLERAPSTVSVGARFGCGSFAIEVGGGTRLGGSGAESIVWMEVSLEMAAPSAPEP